MIIESPPFLPAPFFFAPMVETPPRVCGAMRAVAVRVKADDSAQAANSMKGPRRKGDTAFSGYTRAMPAGRPRALACLVALACALVAANGGWSERSSSHFQLYESVGFARYSGPEGSREFERAVLATLENAHARVRDQLKVSPRNRVKVFVYAPDAFDAEYAGRFGFRAAGFWDGAIHVRGGLRFDARLVSTLHHEYVHAALETVAPRSLWPAWLNEGMAEYFERQALGQSHLAAR